ncbi:aminoacetone oxidase family FAD-binding enzyme [Ureaplasma ceti]|uniref:NAD(P)/FAD-dependent oxidoreductase n=1 Tax=Ureaplasma ceti TaxID=3119530 RepID=A0ABP9U6Z3_9BACT
MQYDVIIIGAGPAGCYLALHLDKNLKVLVIDKNSDIMKKFLLSGNGKANITNCCSFEELLKNMIFGTKNFMYHAFKTHPHTEILQLVDSVGLHYVQKENSTKMHMLSNNQIFINRMKDLLEEHDNLGFSLSTKVVSCRKGKDDLFYVDTNKDTFVGKNLVIATGGLSFSKFCGDTGDGYRFAKSFNIDVNRTFPMGISLPLEEQLKQFTSMSGTSFSQVTARLYKDKKLIVEETHDMMITHNGLGGPLIRRISGYVTYWENQGVKVELDLLKESAVRNALNKVKTMSEFWKEFEPFSKKFVMNFNERLGLEFKTDVKNLSKAKKQEIVDFFCNIPVEGIIEKFDVEQAINTGGGISTKKLNPKNFMSNEIDSLYFIGEVLDVNAKTGGFNLTVCYSSARCCADDINKKSGF